MMGAFPLACVGDFRVIRFGLIDRCSMCSRKIPGGIYDLVEPRLANISASLLLSRRM